VLVSSFSRKTATRIKGRFAVAAFLFVFLAIVGCHDASRQKNGESSRPGTSSDTFSRLDSYVRGAMEQWSVPGLAIAVVRNDSTLFARGYGVREIGTRDSVNTSTVFGLLSPTKTFTTTALAMLAEEDKLSWNDPVLRHLPDFRLSDSARTERLTIRDLVSHRSGYADPVQLWYESDLSREEIVDRLATIEPDAPLRSKFLYDNVMYVVAGEVIEAVSGRSWEDYMRKRILGPLDMDRSAATPSTLAERSNAASPHARRFFGTFGPIQPSGTIRFENIAPAGAIQTTARDMTTWLKVHLNEGEYNGGRLLEEASVRDLRKPRIAVPAEQLGPLSRAADSMAYGSGWFLLDYRGRNVAMHGGGAPGLRSYVGIMPSKNLGVVVLSNMDGTEVSQALTYYVFDLFTEAKPMDWSKRFYEVSRSWWQFW
jgi:CubicO group peptidase (beta-lactamase class C family)